MVTQSGRIGLAVVLSLALVVAGLAATGPVGATDDASAPAADTEGGDPSSVVMVGEGELLYSAENNRLRRFDTDTIGTAAPANDIVIERSGDEPDGRDVNGEICFLPDGSGRFVMGEDTGQPTPPAGWGIFDPDGSQVGKLTATYFVDGAEPFGCEFAADGTLFTSEVGFQGFGTANGQLMMWFPGLGLDGAPASFCKLATDLGTAGAVAIDGLGRVYVAQTSGLRIDRFSPPFPTSADAAGGCGGTDSTGAPVADTVQRDVFATPGDGMLTFSGLASAPNGNLYASSVLTGRIAEYDLDGNLVRLLLEPDEAAPPIPTGHPQGLAVGADGTVYFADLDLQGTLPDVSPGPDGKIRRIRFDLDGNPLDPEIVRSGLRFPDGLGIGPGDLEIPEPVSGPWPTHAGDAERRFFNADEAWLTPESVPRLVEKWRFPTDAVVTASPSVADVEIDGETVRAVFVSSWDGFVYAIDFTTGDELWRFAWEDQPGASFPAAASVTVTEVDGDDVVLIGVGEIMYAINAGTGTERWRFTAGTGCRDLVTGEPPGLCGFGGERNQVESTPIVAHGTAYFGMDINDVDTGKGGFFAVDVRTGSMVWYFDVETGATCHTFPGDDVRFFDGYHSEAELQLPAGFFESRPGCDHDRGPTGCGNVWSSPAYDDERELLYFGTSNCDTDLDPATPAPTPIMPAYDEAIVALGVDGSPAWRWRPREIDPDDLAFGGVPNLFTIDRDGATIDVVGLGNKDGTYYVIDRDGVNETTGLAWDDADPRALPYWETNVVPGGAIGGIIATASVDQAANRVLFSTAPGFDPVAPQQPTVHALDIDTGEVIWQNTADAFPGNDGSYAPTSAVPGVVIVGSVVTPHLRMFDSTDGTLLYDQVVGQPGTFSGIASGAAVVDGTVVVGAGIGARSGGGSSPGDFSANTPSAIVALCVPGSPDCPAPLPQVIPDIMIIDEGDGPMSIDLTVTLSYPMAVPVTVEWFVEDAGTLDATEFPRTVPTLGRPATILEFVPGQTSATVTVEFNGDTEPESSEFGVVRFRNPQHARLGGFFGLGLIGVLDDDS